MSSDKTVRQHIIDELTPNLPAEWRIEDGIPTLGTLSKPVLWIEYTELAPLEGAPLSHIAASADLCIATNQTDMRKAEDAADEHVAALYEAAFAAGSFYAISAKKTVFNDQYLGWRMSITVALQKPTKE